MNRDLLREVIIDQREASMRQPYIHRNYALEQNINYCFVGIRRAGKSFLMYQQLHNHLKAGIEESQLLYINFEDERLMELTAEDLNLILEVGMELAGPGKELYLFLDEIQNVEGWAKFARRLADMKYRVSITGSNAKMLSREIASTLGGRYMIQPVYPYEFEEYLTARGITTFSVEDLSTRTRAAVIGAYQDYAAYGAFPELVDIQAKRDYLRSIYQTIYLGDVITRNQITNDFAVRLILKKTAESVMRPLSFSRLTNILTGAGLSIGKSTVIKYMGYMMGACLLFPICNFASKLVEKETAPKYYFMDTGLLGLFLLKGESARLENLVAIELLRRYGADQIYYYEKTVEVNFYLPERQLAIQVCYQLRGSEETFDRETGALVKLSKRFPDTECMIITNSEEETFLAEGVSISVIPAWKWLLLP